MCIRIIESEGSYTCVLGVQKVRVISFYTPNTHVYDPSLSIPLIHMYMTPHFLYS
jgi:hypothetical protein